MDEGRRELEKELREAKEEKEKLAKELQGLTVFVDLICYI